MPNCTRWLVVAIACAPVAAHAEPGKPDKDADLAEKLANPIASLISIPFQSNLDLLGGTGDGVRYLMNFQPVVPIELTGDLNLISRTILPVIAQEDMVGSTGQGGLGDIVQSLFLSPAKAGPGPLIWGVGPVVLVPTATSDMFGSGKLGIGPTAVALVQAHGFTVGVLANHIWSVAGSSSRAAVSSTFLQPFVAYITSTHTTLSVNTESTYDWESSQWTVPLNAQLSQLVRIEKLPVQFGLGPRVYVAGPSGVPDWGLRATMTILLPR